MSKTVTLRLNDDTYAKFRAFAESDNRSLSNFIETSALRYISGVNILMNLKWLKLIITKNYKPVSNVHWTMQKTEREAWLNNV